MLEFCSDWMKIKQNRGGAVIISLYFIFDKSDIYKIKRKNELIMNVHNLLETFLSMLIPICPQIYIFNQH